MLPKPLEIFLRATNAGAARVSNATVQYVNAPAPLARLAQKPRHGCAHRRRSGAAATDQDLACRGVAASGLPVLRGLRAHR